MRKHLTNGMKRNWQTKAINGPIGRTRISLTFPKSRAAPKLIYKIETSTTTDMVKMRSIKRSSRIITTLNDSLERCECPLDVIFANTLAKPKNSPLILNCPVHVSFMILSNFNLLSITCRIFSSLNNTSSALFCINST